MRVPPTLWTMHFGLPVVPDEYMINSGWSNETCKKSMYVSTYAWTSRASGRKAHRLNCKLILYLNQKGRPWKNIPVQKSMGQLDPPIRPKNLPTKLLCLATPHFVCSQWLELRWFSTNYHQFHCKPASIFLNDRGFSYCKKQHPPKIQSLDWFVESGPIPLRHQSRVTYNS